VNHQFVPFLKTRIAPTPSGFLHLGNVLSFAITANIARKSRAKILLRIDDLDRARVNEEYVQDIFDTLDFLEIPWDEGPRDAQDFDDTWSQLHRIGKYTEALKQLADCGQVFACTCSRNQLQVSSCNCAQKHLPLNTPDVAWRLLTNGHSEIIVRTLGDAAIQATLPIDMQNFVVKKKDGFPAYQLTSVIDDLVYGIDLVVRGDDLWPSTLAQHALASALGQERFYDITFCHHLLLTENNGVKLSKSAGATSIKHLRENGKNRQQVYTMLAGMMGINEALNNWEELAQLVSIPTG